LLEQLLLEQLLLEQLLLEQLLLEQFLEQVLLEQLLLEQLLSEQLLLEQILLEQMFQSTCPCRWPVSALLKLRKTKFSKLKPFLSPGGATAFPYVGVTAIPEKGSAVAWFNTRCQYNKTFFFGINKL
jgi:hypothetical protein